MMQEHMDRPKPRKRTRTFSGACIQSPPSLRQSAQSPSLHLPGVPLADNPYARLTNTIYVGERRAIFRKKKTSQRNAVALYALGILCALMTVALIAFFVGKDAGIAEAGTAPDSGQPAETQQHDQTAE